MPSVALTTAIDEVARIDPVLASLVEAAGPIRWRPRDPDGPFGALVRSIVFQQLAGRAANAIHGRVRALVDGPLDPESLAAVPDDDLRGAGLSAAKLAALRDLSAKVLDGVRGFPRTSSPGDRHRAGPVTEDALPTATGQRRPVAEVHPRCHPPVRSVRSRGCVWSVAS